MKRRLQGALVLSTLVASGARAQVASLGTVQLLGASSSFNTGIGFGARALGMAGAFSAVADDASAASWNPAGLAQLERPEVTIVGGFSGARLDSVGEASRAFDAGGALASIAPTERDYRATAGGLQFLSLAVPVRLGRQLVTLQLSYSRFAQPVDADATEVRRVLMPDGGLVESFPVEFKVRSGGAFEVAGLALATGWDDRFFAGATFNGWFGGTSAAFEGRYLRVVRGADGVGAIDSDFRAERLQERSIRGISVNAGVLARVHPKLTLGFVYRGGFSGTESLTDHYAADGFRKGFDGHGDQLYPFTATASVESQSTLSWPSSFGGGLAYRPIDRLTLALDATSTLWSGAGSTATPYIGARSCADVPGRVDCTYTFTPRDVPFPSLLSGVSQNDQTAIRLGVEYLLRPSSGLVLPVRLGIYRITTIAPLFADYDSRTTVDDAGTGLPKGDQDPRAAFVGVSAGAGIVVSLAGATVIADVAAVLDQASSTYSRRVASPEGGVIEDEGERRLRAYRVVGSLVVRF